MESSCAYTVIGPYYSTGSVTPTLTASNGTATPVSKSGTVTIGSAPYITTITDTNGSTYITTISIIQVWGDGLNTDGGNTIQFHNNSTNSDWWFYEGDGDPYYYDQSYHFIQSSLINNPPAGNYTVYSRNPNHGNPSAGHALTIHYRSHTTNEYLIRNSPLEQARCIHVRLG